MCRMLFAAGNFNIDGVIQDFILMASDQNEKHEKNRDKIFKHGDGWGIAYLEDDRLKVFRSTKAVYKDDQINQFKNLQSNLVILHARKASKGSVNIKNVHPFECKLNGHHYFFFHNGTIRDEILFDPQFHPMGKTDSERLFYYLLTNTNGELTEDDLRVKLNSIKNFTAANFILSDGAISYFTSWYAENQNYYTLKLLQKNDCVIVASEILSHYKTGDWRKLDNHDIICVQTSGLSVKIGEEDEH
jgi:predicted glutamine amidotransferase